MMIKIADWIPSTNIYEVNVRQYTADGTFHAFALELPRLKDMGVEILWFMPITPISKKNSKGSLGSPYACSDYTTINPEFGTEDDFKNLVKLAHEMGFKVIIDWVANHTGWDHVWTKSHPDYYLRDPDETSDFKMASGMDDIIELDYKNADMRKAMIDAMQHWITSCDIDGFRCDLAFWVTLDFWKEARPILEKIKHLFWLGELDPVEHAEYYDVFDSAYTWTWMHKTEDFYKGKIDFDLLKMVLHQYQNVCGASKLPVWFTSNHDENSWNGTEYEKYGDMAKSLAVFSFTWFGLPMIYSGQELPNLKRLQFFDKDTIDWNGIYELHEFYKTLLSLKKNNVALWTNEKSETHLLNTSSQKNCFGFIRKSGNDEVLVLLNWSNEKIFLFIEDELLNGKYKNVFTNAENIFSTKNNFEMDSWGFVVLEKL